ncbi:MAG: metallophosphoesterase family protein [Pseudarcicella sp.]|nr:metallophosphoesterase family protein [Pseudarcicella sp.]MBP6410210.1 metallophosphoesterase family protein [Pseudarcicella sp.]
MQKILIISDTHSYLDQRLMPHIEWADQIWHAGDWGNESVVDTLESFKPIQGVYGNIDNAVVKRIFPKINHFMVEEICVGITHIAGAPSSYKQDALECFAIRQPDIFVCGHSHILQVKRDFSRNKMLFINPGAAGKHGFHSVQTAIRLKIEKKRIFDLEVIEMTKNDKLFQ